ncbi:MAG: PhoU domain-containing protein [Pseudonocardiaceae bacterium]
MIHQQVSRCGPARSGIWLPPDDEVDGLRHRIRHILSSPDWPHGVEPAVDAALIDRYYERFADHAVAIARQVSFLPTTQQYRS